MLIKNIEIYGFGKWQDFQLKLPENKLIFIYGENEAGKSTLRQFLLFLLFGFPPRKREQFRPKTGGRIGGRMEIWTKKHGFFTIERIHEKNNGEAICYLSDGSVQGEEWLKEALQRMDAKMFQSIFSFSANDLNYLHKVKQEEIGEVLLGMGVAGINALHEAEKKLEQNLEARFRPQGKNPPINKQIKVLEATDKKLQDLEKEEELYQVKKQKETEIVSELNNFTTRLEEIGQKENELKKNIQARPLLFDYFSTKSELPDEKDIRPFPEDGIERYNKWKEAALPLESELSVLTANRDEYVDNSEKIAEKLLSYENQKQMDILEQEISQFKRKADKQDFQEQEHKELETKIKNELEVQNTGLHFEELEELSLPFYTEDRWDNWRQEHQLVRGELSVAREKERELERSLEEIQSDKSFLEKKLIEEEKGNASQNEGSLPENEQSISSQREPGKTYPSFFWLGVGLIVAGILFILSFSFNSDWLLVFSVLSFAVSFGRWLWDRYSKKLIRQLINDKQSPDPAGSSPDKSGTELKLENINEKLSKQKLEILKLQEKIKYLEEQLERLQMKIKEETKAYPFLRGLEVEQWPKFYAILHQILYKFKQYTSLRQSIGQLEIEKNSFREQVANFLQRIKKDETGEMPEDPVNNLIEEIKKQKRYREEQKRNEAMLSQVESSINACRHKLRPYQREMEHLLTAAKTDTEEDFYAKGKKRELYFNKRKVLSSLMQQLKGILEEAELDSIFQGEVPVESKLEQEIEDERKKRKELNFRIGEIRQELADLRSSIAAMESSEQLSELRHRFEQEKALLQEKARDWARYKLAMDTLVKTKKEYMQKYFPEVMSRTSEIFRTMTQENYLRVMLTDDKMGLLAENKDGIRFEVQELSKGTNDQLYVALKIALSEITNKNSPLPFFIDDAFVHFDDSRIRSLPAILEKSNSSNQVIWFTCNKPVHWLNSEKYGFVELEKEKKGPISIS